MFGLYMLAIYLGVAVIAAGFVALLVVVALAVGLVTHPIRTLALVFHKLAALAAGLALILALIAWFWTDHAKPDFIPCFWGSIGVIVASIIIRAFAEWILERPTRAERPRHETGHHRRRGAGRVTMRMPVSEEDGLRRSNMDVQDNTGRGDGETVRKVMTTFQMDADLKAELKRYCADNGMKMGETINQAIEQWLQTK